MVYSVLTGRTRAPARGLIAQNAIHATIDRLAVSLESMRTLGGDQNPPTTGAFSPAQPSNHAVGNANKPFKVRLGYG